MKEITPAVFRETVAKVAPSSAIVHHTECLEHFGNGNYKRVRIYLLRYPKKYIYINHWGGITTFVVAIGFEYGEVVTHKLRYEIAKAMDNATVIMDAIAKLHAEDDS